MEPEQMPQADPPVDEQGEPWPAETALVAVVKDYGAPFDGKVVEVGPWLPAYGYFECCLTETNIEGLFGVGDPLLCTPEEMIACNKATADYMAETQVAAVEIYPDDVYELRDLLDGVGVAVKAESVATWTSIERHRVGAWAKALAEYQHLTGSKDTKHPSLPTPIQVA